MRIALVMPKGKGDYLAETIADGLAQMPEHEVKDASADMPYAKAADLILFFWGKNATDYNTAAKIGRWDKTAFIDGSELGGNRRYDPEIRKAVEDGTYEGQGRVDKEMLERCSLYFRRERPYGVQWSPKKIIPLPFGIETKYVSRLGSAAGKDIDFTCIFGQDEYPELRGSVRRYLERYCAWNGFTCATKKTNTREEFYDILARTKVGVSVGGGGFDTARFWEILGNNCLLMTETIDIYEPDSGELEYGRIYQFGGLPSFAAELEKVALFLRNGYDYAELAPEYERIMARHSSKSRAEEILEAARREGII